MCRGSFPSRYMTPEGKALKEDYQWQAKQQWLREPLTEDGIEIDIKLFFGTKRRYDIDNYGKILLDSLTGIVWVDDSLVTKATVEKFIDRLNPRIEITIL